MTPLAGSGIASWLNAEETGAPGVYKTRFEEHHLGNIWIRSLHGGVTGSMIEVCAEAETRKHADSDADLMIISNSTDYLRITKDVDLFVRTSIKRISRRLSVVDVTCWQDSEEVPVATGVVTIKIG